jgi:hypothetical protein
MGEAEGSLDQRLADANRIISTLNKQTKKLAVAAKPADDLLREIEALVEEFLDVVGRAMSLNAEVQEGRDHQADEELLESAVDDLTKAASSVTSAIAVFEDAFAQDSTRRRIRAGLPPQDVGGRATYIQERRDAIVLTLMNFRSRCRSVIQGLGSKPEGDDRRLAR